MSGGYFDYKEYNIEYIANELEDKIEGEKERIKEEDPFCCSPQMVEEMERILKRLREDYVLVSNLDYYLDGDMDEKRYFEKTENDLKKL